VGTRDGQSKGVTVNNREPSPHTQSHASPNSLPPGLRSTDEHVPQSPHRQLSLKAKWLSLGRTSSTSWPPPRPHDQSTHSTTGLGRVVTQPSRSCCCTRLQRSTPCNLPRRLHRTWCRVSTRGMRCTPSPLGLQHCTCQASTTFPLGTHCPRSKLDRRPQHRGPSKILRWLPRCRT
jgi:hypothetical protein